MCLTGFEANPVTGLQLVFLLLMLIYWSCSYSCFYLSLKMFISGGGLHLVSLFLKVLYTFILITKMPCQFDCYSCYCLPGALGMNDRVADPCFLNFTCFVLLEFPLNGKCDGEGTPACEPHRVSC
jgi:hypothetical protein